MERLDAAQKMAYLTLGKTVFMKNWGNFNQGSMFWEKVEVNLPSTAIPPRGVTRREVQDAALTFMDYHGLVIPGLELRYFNKIWPERLFSLLFPDRQTTPLTIGSIEANDDFFFRTAKNDKFLASIRHQGIGGSFAWMFRLRIRL